MKIISFALMIIVLGLSAAAQVKQPAVAFDPSYKSAEFTDPARLDRIKLTFPAIEKIYKEYAAKNHFPGIAFGIVVDGKLVFSGSDGFTDIEKKIPVTSSSLFRIASMSKSFTAMAILKLRDDGKLSLDDPAYLYVPELKNQKYPTADSTHITIRQLLTHGAGFPEDNPWGDRQLADTNRELSELLERQISFSNPPGIAYEYANLGFALLGRIVTKVSGKPYQQYIRENIWRPLGMNTSEWEYANVDPDKLAHGYRWERERWNEETLLHDTADGSWGAMGSMISSIDEFGKYMAFHLSAWPPSNAAETGPIKRASVREMHHPWRFNSLNPNFKYPGGRVCATAGAYSYGLGWLRDCDERVYVGHSGGLPGFGSQWRVMPEYGIGVVAFGNVTYASLGGVNLQVLDLMIREAGLKPRQLPVSAILAKRKAELLKVIPAWDTGEKSGIFAENFFPDNPIDLLKKEYSELWAKAGKVIAVRELIPENQLRGRFIIECENANIEVYFTLSPENPPLIQQLDVREVAKK
ncbi:MAG: beta-lactamase family protein [Pyrinomonadaceae bacterium]|nr:beta-lactamase family protein [Pyrinomonadaceae bacterium]MBP6212322.1 beta-lactamase family protein [Pyrinomonadaceae bacterium]